MITLIRTDAFAKWLKQLADATGRARILARLDAAVLGNFGDCESLGGGVSEMRIHTGPGYRVYFTRRGRLLWVATSRRRHAISSRAIEMARNLEERA